MILLLSVCIFGSTKALLIVNRLDNQWEGSLFMTLNDHIPSTWIWLYVSEIMLKCLGISSHNRHVLKVLLQNVTTPVAYSYSYLFSFVSLNSLKKRIDVIWYQHKKKLAEILQQKPHTVSSEVPSATNLFACTTRKHIRVNITWKCLSQQSTLFQYPNAPISERTLRKDTNL